MGVSNEKLFYTIAHSKRRPFGFGISRSASFVIAYLMKYYEMNLEDAFLYVRKRRNRICPNKQFMTYLYEYEFKLFGENSLTYDEYVNLFYYT